MDVLDPIISQIKARLEGKIDFAGQERTEQLARQIMWLTGLIAFVVGAALQSLQTTFILLTLGTVGCAITVIPSWPAYNQHKTNWLPPLTEDGQVKPPGEELTFEVKKDR